MADDSIPLFKVFMSNDAVKAVPAVLQSGYIAQGPVVQEFEQELGKFIGNDNVLTLNSATSGLHLALHMLRTPDGTWPGIQDGDEILSTALTCTATNWPILSNGYNIKWVDVDLRTCNMDLDDLKSKISCKTKVIVFVHWGGSPINLQAIQDIQEYCFNKHGFTPAVIEDCAHAIGAEFDGRKLGSHGNICVFSLQAIKHLTSGDGGFVVLPTRRMFERAKLLRWYGIDRDKKGYSGADFRLENDIAEFGFKFHMNDISAQIGLSNLQYLPSILRKHRENAKFFSDQLRGMDGLELIYLPKQSVSSYWMFSLRIKRKWDFVAFMKEKHVTVSQVHNRNDKHSCCAEWGSHLPNLDILEKELICIPCGWWLSESDRQYIVNCIVEFCTFQAVATTPRRKAVVVTGGCGFIGHHVVEHLAKSTDYNIIVIDKLSYASLGYERLRDTGVMDAVRVFSYDICTPLSLGMRYELGDNVEFIVHMAAETHVDNSIADPVPFVKNNVESTLTMLEWCRGLNGLKAFFYFSTDEVFGPAPDGTAYEEWDRHCPTNPYSASKSAAENICIAYENTYKVPLMIVNVMNAFGERQHPEKFIPKTIKNILMGATVSIHSYEDQRRAGSRFYIHGRNIAAAVLFLLKEGSSGEKYNIAGEREVDNLEMAQVIAEVVGEPLNYEMVNFHASRPGHDLRYALSGKKMQNMGWKLPLTFEESLRKTILWSLDNPKWLDQDAWVPSGNSASSKL